MIEGERRRLGAVVEVQRIRTAIDIQPFFGECALAESRLTSTNGMELSTEFNLNKYCDKETFYLLHDY
jgi:hypothetical protein